MDGVQNIMVFLCVIALVSSNGLAWISIRRFERAHATASKLLLAHAETKVAMWKILDETLLDHYFGQQGSERRDLEEQIRRDLPKRTPMASVLFGLHTHGEMVDPNEIVYREKDIVELLRFLQYEVEFGDDV